MRVGMIQSNYIPWRGYFDFIDDCDLFVFYDDVQYTHKGWRNRNRVKTAAGPAWLSVPVLHDRDTRIQDARIAYDTRWVDKHLRTLELAYGRMPGYAAHAPGFAAILRDRPGTISELNVRACRWAMDALGIGTRTMMSGELGIDGDRAERPLRILRALGADAYLTGPAALDYTPAAAFADAGIALEAKSYDYPEYPQPHGPWLAEVSILDTLFCLGGDARAVLKSRTPNHRIA